MQKFSVLMSVYYKENPKWLSDSLNSIFNQTVLPSEVVIVKDGPLTRGLDSVIEDFRSQYSVIKVITFTENRGLGKALCEGLLHCSYDFVARMDSDDICMPERFEKQLKVFEKYPDIDVCSSWIKEFSESVGKIIGIRRLPECHDELYRYGKSRNPVNHPACMFRKNSVIESGNYQDYPLIEDYFLWARMMVKGFKFYCIQESLLYFRRTPEMIKRRGGFSYAMTETKFQWTLYELGYISCFCAMRNVFVRFMSRMAPAFIRAQIYKMIRSF